MIGQWDTEIPKILENKMPAKESIKTEKQKGGGWATEKDNIVLIKFYCLRDPLRLSLVSKNRASRFIANTHFLLLTLLVDFIQLQRALAFKFIFEIRASLM